MPKIDRCCARRRARYVLLVAFFGSWTFSVCAAGEDVSYAKAVSNRLNTTGRTIDTNVPLKIVEKEVGDIAIRIAPDDAILVNRADLAKMLGGVLDATSQERLAAMPAKSPFVGLAELDAAGYDFRFDPALQELRFNPTVSQRNPTDLSLSGRRQSPTSSTLAVPAYASGYVNLYASLDRQWDSSVSRTSDGDTSGRLEMNSAIRVGGLVFENSGVLAGSVDINVCPTAAICNYVHTPGFKRQMSRLVYDMPEHRIRSEFGDVEPLGAGFQRTPELLGFSVEKSARKLTPGDTFAPTGNGSFTVDRPSKVEIRVNGILRHQLQLQPGQYNLRDLQLATGTNNIDVAITDDTGQAHTVTFMSYFDMSLLSAGKSEWGLTGGLPSYLRDEERDYLPDLYMASAYFRYGLHEGITTESDIQANKHVGMVGVGTLIDTGFGLAGPRAAVSAGQFGEGFALGLDWSVLNFQWLTPAGGESFRFSSEYRNPDFHSPGDIDTFQTGIIFPEWNYWLNLSVTWSAPIAYGTTLALSARYQFVDDAEVGPTIYALNGDRYGADITLSRALTETLSGSLTIGISNESFLATLDRFRDSDPEFRIGVRLFDRPDESTSITAGYDSLDAQTDLSAYRSEGNGMGRWDTSIYVQQSEFSSQAALSASAGYYGNRAQVRVIHNSGFDGISYSGFDIRPGPQRTSLQIGTALAFADDKIAIGAPVTGDAFAIVYPHDTIADKEITVGAPDSIKAVADGWGPALVTSLPVYAPSTLSVDANDLPVGYSLGSAAFDTFAPFKAGYALEVGSAYSVSAYGTLVLEDGNPVALLSGVARSIEDPRKTVTIFTNASGRFGADGLAPGRWRIEIETDGSPTTFNLDIPSGTEGLFKAGTLRAKPRQ